MNRKEKYLFYCLLVCLCLCSSCAQVYYRGFIRPNDMVYERQDKPVARPNPCHDYNNYIPDTNRLHFSPMRYVRLNIHFINSADSTQNFKPQEGIRFAQELVNHANYLLSVNHKMFLPPGNNTPVLPTQYRYVLTGKPDDPDDLGVYFHYNDSLFICNKKDYTSRSIYSLFYGGQFDLYGVQKNEALNVFFVEHPPDSLGSPTYKFTTNGVGKPDWAKMVGAFHHFTTNKDPVTGASNYNGGSIAGLFNHELGHSVGLAHTWNLNDGCDDTPMNPNHWNFPEVAPEKHNEVSNNVMDYNAFQNAWTPCQIGKVQLNCATPNSLQRRIIRPDWCHYDPTQPIQIYPGDTVVWLGNKDFNTDIIVHHRAQLTIHCTVSLPQGAAIKVKMGGTLVLDGATITNLCNQKWRGIEVEKRFKKRSRIVLKRNAQLLNMQYELHNSK